MVSERTVQRLRTAIKGFHNHRPDGEIAMATGWSRQRISELKGYWTEDLAPQPLDVEPSRQLWGQVRDQINRKPSRESDSCHLPQGNPPSDGRNMSSTEMGQFPSC